MLTNIQASHSLVIKLSICVAVDIQNCILIPQLINESVRKVYYVISTEKTSNLTVPLYYMVYLRVIDIVHFIKYDPFHITDHI